VLAANPTHLSNTGCEEAAKRAGERSCGEENGCSDSELAALVPAAVFVNMGLLLFEVKLTRDSS
jgi:hypothetical protein